MTFPQRVLTKAQQALPRHRVVPLLVVLLRSVSPLGWQRGRFLGIGPPHHRINTMKLLIGRAGAGWNNLVRVLRTPTI